MWTENIIRSLADWHPRKPSPTLQSKFIECQPTEQNNPPLITWNFSTPDILAYAE